MVLFGGVRGMKRVMDAETGMVQEVPLCGQEIHSFSIGYRMYRSLQGSEPTKFNK